MIRKTLTILFTLACLLPAISLSQDKTPPALPRLTFSDLKKPNLIEGTFTVVGFVVQTYKCPPCPPLATCKPCLGDHILVTDNLDEKDPDLIQRLRIFTDKPERFELKKKYIFTVKVKSKALSGQALPDVNLISFEQIKK